MKKVGMYKTGKMSWLLPLNVIYSMPSRPGIAFTRIIIIIIIIIIISIYLDAIPL